MYVRVGTAIAVFMLLASDVSAQASSSEHVVSYDKGLRVGRKTDASNLKFFARVQGRFEVEREEPDVDSEFLIPRLRAGVQGRVFSRLGYKVQLDFADGVEVKDVYGDLSIVPDVLRLRAGKFKRPGFRDSLTSSSRLALVDRGITSKAFDAGRDIGLMVHNGVTGNQRITWGVGAFRDTSNRVPLVDRSLIEATASEEFEPAFAARLTLNFGEVEGFDNIDWDAGGLRGSIGLSAFESLDTGGEGDGRLRGSADYALQYAFMTVSGDVHVANQQTNDGSDYDGWGFHHQFSGLFFHHLAPAVRFALVAPDDAATSTEITGGLSYFFWKHRLKLTADASALRGPEGASARGRVQAQVIL